MKNSRYWTERLSRYGHTGWSNPALYVFDQKYRIQLIAKAIEGSQLGTSSLIDYGCGNGDFSLYFSSVFNNVYAVDIGSEILNEASRVNKKDNIKFLLVDDLKKNIQKHSIDCVISVTVLQHILDRQELLDVLEDIHFLLKKNGKFLVYESFSLEKISNIKNKDYQSIRSYEEWIDILSENFYITKVDKHRKSYECLSAEYSLFRRSFLVKTLCVVYEKINFKFFNLFILKILKYMIKDFRFNLLENQLYEEGDSSTMALFFLEPK